MIIIELTEEEAQALVGHIVKTTNALIAAGDPDDYLKHLEHIEEMIIGAQDDAAIACAKIPLTTNATL